MDKYPYPKLMLANAWVTLSCWLSLLITCTAALSGITPDVIVEYSLALFFVFAALHFILALLLKCPACGKRPTVQMLNTHPESETVYGIDGWGGVILSSAFKRKFKCIHCAKDYAL